MEPDTILASLFFSPTRLKIVLFQKHSETSKPAKQPFGRTRKRMTALKSFPLSTLCLHSCLIPIFLTLQSYALHLAHILPWFMPTLL